MMQGLSATFLATFISIVEKVPENDATRQAHTDLSQAMCMYQVDITKMKQLAAGTYEMTTENPEVEKSRTLHEENIKEQFENLLELGQLYQNTSTINSTSRPSSIRVSCVNLLIRFML